MCERCTAVHEGGMDVSVCAAQVNPWSAARLTDIVGAIVCAMCGCGPGEGPAGLTNDMLWARMLCAVYTLYSEVIGAFTNH